MAGKRRYSVMLSSSFEDLREQRQVATEALEHAKLFVDRMETDGARPGIDVIDSSLQKVDEAHGYLLLLGRRYGEPPVCPDRNPEELSATHLEFNRAVERGIPIAVIKLADVYPLAAFEEPDALRAKRDVLRADAQKSGVYDEVDDFKGFCQAAPKAASALLEALQRAEPSVEAAINSASPSASSREASDAALPDAPAFREVRPFAQGMSFVGRGEDLDRITAWARSDDPLMLIEAMGGMGKSMLTYHWITEHAESVLPDLAGRLWYSFYEEGADTADFSRKALAYIEGVHERTFEGTSRADLADRLVSRLRERPWMIVLDGLERVLVEYGRHDRAGLRSEFEDVSEPVASAGDAESSEERPPDPNLCIRPDDDTFLRALAGARPSKLLASTRNMPTALLNEAHKPRTGVWHEHLHGLAGADALHLIRSVGVRGDGVSIVGYLERHFGSHPLMIGVVAGLVNDHVPSPGDFDDWLQHPNGARALDLARVDGLISKRTHVLRVAFDSLTPDARLLLTTLALFSSAASYDTLEAALVRPTNFDSEQGSAGKALRLTATHLSTLVIELRRRGLVVAGEGAGSYDLHPLVRGFVRDTEKGEARRQAGEVVVDYARTEAPPSLADDATREEVDRYFALVEALLLADQRDEAAQLLATCSAFSVSRVGLMRRFFELLAALFEPGMEGLATDIPESLHALLANRADNSAYLLGLPTQARNAGLINLQLLLRGDDLRGVHVSLCNLSLNETDMGCTASAVRIQELSTLLSSALGAKTPAANNTHRLTTLNLHLGRLDWQTYAPEANLDEPAAFSGSIHLRSSAWTQFLKFRRLEGTLEDKDFEASFDAVSGDKLALMRAHSERARWLQARGDHVEAKAAFESAVALGRETDLPHAKVEARLAVSLAALGRREDAREIALRLADAREPAHLELAQIFLALGESEKARLAALAAYPAAWANGPPYAFHWDLEECRTVLAAVGEPEPKLPSTRPEDLPPLPFEADVRQLVAKYLEEKSAREQ